jgi:hypothetical protein
VILREKDYEVRAYCETGPGGGVDNSCPPGQPDAKASGGDDWKSKESATWKKGDKIPVSDDQGVASVDVGRVQSFKAAEEDTGVSLQDAIAIGGGNIRGARVTVASDWEEFGTVTVMVRAPVDRDAEIPDGPPGRLGTEGQVGWSVQYHESQGDLVVHYGSLYTPEAIVSGEDKAGNLRVASLMTEKFLESMATAERVGAKRATLSASGDASDSTLKGYRLWPTFGFDGPVDWKKMKVPPEIVLKAHGIEVPPEGSFSRIPRATVISGLLMQVPRGEVSLQKLISTREGERWWSENGRDISLEFDFSDKKSLGYKRFQKQQRLASRLKDRNKSRDAYGWLVSSIEFRSRVGLGTFDLLWEIMGDELEDEAHESRAYCNTGEDGGVDNSCPPGDPNAKGGGKPKGEGGSTVERIVESPPTERSRDGKSIVSTKVADAKTFEFGGRQFIQTVSVGQHLAEIQAEDRGGRTINTSQKKGQLSAEDRDYMVSTIADQASRAMGRGIEPKFYSREELALQVELFSQLVPQVKGGTRKVDGSTIESQEAEHLFRVVQALTSPNATPSDNMRRTEDILSRFFSGDGRLDADALGVTAKGIRTSLSRYQRLIDVLGKRTDGSIDTQAGLAAARELLTGRYLPVKEIDRMFDEFKTRTDSRGAWRPSSYLVDQVVPVFSTFGPKVGPFFANNHHELDPLTADIWFTRTWGRTSGELVKPSSMSSVKKHSANLSRAIKRAKEEHLHGHDGESLVREIAEASKSGQVGDVLRSWSSARLRHYAAGGFTEKKGVGGTLNRIAKNIVDSDVSLLGDPSSGSRRAAMISVMREVSDRVKQPVAYVQDILWQDEQDAYAALGAKTAKPGVGQLSLYSDQIERLVAARKKASRRSADGEYEVSPQEFADELPGTNEQLLWESAFAGVSDEEFVDALLKVLKNSVPLSEYEAEKRNFAPLEQRQADCGRDEGGRFGSDNDCQAGGSGGKDKNKKARDTAREISGPIKSDDPRIKAEKKPFAPTSEPNSNFVSVPSDEKVRDALSSDKQAKFGANRDLSDGHPVDLRIDIPAFERKEVYAVTVHEQTGTKRIGSPIGYDSVVRLSGDVSFSTNEYVATQIVLGHQKTPLATVRGKFSKSRDVPGDIDSWTPVGFDPKKAAYFYDKKTGAEVLGGEDAISIGNSVFVRKPRKGGRNAKADYRSDVGFWGLESRDCGRTDDGKFGSDNKCQDGAGDGLLDSDSKKTWHGEPDRKPFDGAEKYKEVSVTGGKSVGESLSKIGLDLSAAIAATGAQEKSYVWARQAPEFINFKAFEGSDAVPVFIGYTHDAGGIRNGVESTSVLGERKTQDGKTERVLYHNVMDVLPDVQESRPARHAAARAFYRAMADSVASAEKSGVAEIKFSAAGDSSDKGDSSVFRGYTIWPRMGFDGPIPKDIREKLPESLSHAKSLLELHATREGTKWWADNGREVDVSMRLGDPNTPQRRVFDRFVKRLRKDSRSIPLGDGTSDEWLSPEDLAKFDEVWQEIWDEGDLDDYEYVESRSADCGRASDGRFDKGNQCQAGADAVAAAARSGASHDELVSAISAAIGTKRGWISGAEKGDSKPSQVLAAIGVTVENAAEIDKYHASSSQKTREGIAHAIAECHAAVKADPSLKGVKFSIMTAGSLADKYGTAESRWAGVSGTFSPADGALHILAGTVPPNLTNDVLHRAGYSSTPSPAHTLIHEVAHRDHFDSIAKAMNSPRPAGDSLKVRDAWAASLRDESNRRLVEAARKDPEWVDRADQKVRSLGIYATSDALEFYAEYATAVKLGYAKNDPDLDKMCKAMLAPVPKRLKK